jgi:hypothetical protein
MINAKAAVRRAGFRVSVRRTAVLTVIAVTQVTWFAALGYGVIWLVT